ncbi:MAG TPA: hypothetical protein VG756_25395 [Pseudonocardiaceae bacterium]|nr:hypothetical protein [Pseudonocardiaceae bacterium]
MLLGDMTDELLVLAVVVFILTLVLRWSFGSETARSGRAERKLAKARDYGLLHEVASAPSEQSAVFARDLLRRNGIRATTVPTEVGDGQRVLVFPQDASAAADVLLRDEETGEQAETDEHTEPND